MEDVRLPKGDVVRGVEEETTMPWNKEEMERSDVRRLADLRSEGKLVSVV